MEFKNGKLQLPNVTLVAMSSVNMVETVKAMKYSMERVDFGEAVLITHKKPLFLPKEITYKHTSKLTNIDCFNYKMAYELGDYIETDFAMIVHADGYVVHPESWRDEFLEYDYIGSPWPMPKPGTKHSYHDIYGNICRVGNSVSLRSKRLMEFPKKANLKWERDEEGFYNEDIFICCTNRHLFEAEGMKWFQCIAPSALRTGQCGIHCSSAGREPLSFRGFLRLRSQSISRRQPCSPFRLS